MVLAWHGLLTILNVSYRPLNGASFGSETEDELEGVLFDVVRMRGVAVSVGSQVGL